MTEEERLLSAASQEAEASIEKSLRPQFLAQYIGQDKVKQELTIYIEAAKNRNEALDHTLLYGPPGCIPQWKIFTLISWSVKEPRHIPFIFRYRLLL